MPAVEEPLETFAVTPHIVVLDVETTGLGHMDGRPDGVVQVGYATRRPGDDQLLSWSRVCNPGATYLEGGRADEALAINGLTVEEVLAAPPAADVAAELRGRLSALAEDVPAFDLRAYNVAFDRPFLEVEPWRLEGPWGPCLMLLAHQRLNPYGKWPKLDEACRALGVELGAESAHDAGEDAKAALRVYERLARSDR